MYPRDHVHMCVYPLILPQQFREIQWACMRSRDYPAMCTEFCLHKPITFFFNKTIFKHSTVSQLSNQNHRSWPRAPVCDVTFDQSEHHSSRGRCLKEIEGCGEFRVNVSENRGQIWYEKAYIYCLHSYSQLISLYFRVEISF